MRQPTTKILRKRDNLHSSIQPDKRGITGYHTVFDNEDHIYVYITMYNYTTIIMCHK